MDNVEKFDIEYKKYTSSVYSEENRRENIVGWIQGLMVLSAIVFPILAIMFSPTYVDVSPISLILIILTTTVIGVIAWQRFESTTDFTEEKVELLELDFQNRFCPETIKAALVEKYKARIMQLEEEVLHVENKKVYYKMIEGLKNYMNNLSATKLDKQRYSYYTLHKYIYFYHMFNSINSYRNRDENHFEHRYNYDY